jgi:hypothetical protein
MRLTIISAALALVCAPLVALDAQQYFIPGAESNGQINVQINATLNDGLDDYHPLADLPITLYRGRRETGVGLAAGH